MSRRNKALTDFANESYVLMHPADCKKYGVQDGDKVKISNKRGDLETVIKKSESVAEGELFMPFHYPESLVNKLTRGDLDPYSKIPP